MYFLRLKGLPWLTKEEHIKKFFGDVIIKNEWINILETADGHESGECLVGVNTVIEHKKCMEKDGQYIGKRYIEIFNASSTEWDRKKNAIHRTHKVPIKDGSFIILMRGLPYGAQEDDCLVFFEPVPCLGVHLTKDKYGRPSGQAYAEFETKLAYKEAFNCHHKNMQKRYIELFEATVEELISSMEGHKRTIKSSFQKRKYNNNNRYRSPYNKNGAGGKIYKKPSQKDCIKYIQKDMDMKYIILVSGLGDVNLHDLLLFFQKKNFYPTMLKKQDGTELYMSVYGKKNVSRAFEFDEKIFQGQKIELELFLC